MTPNTLPHEEAPAYPSAFQLYQTVLEVAQSERQFVNVRLERQAFHVLQHAATAGRCAPHLRARWIEYARMSAARLSAAVDAAWAGRCLSDNQRARLRTQMLQLESEFSQPIPAAMPDAAVTQDATVTPEPVVTPDPAITPEPTVTPAEPASLACELEPSALLGLPPDARFSFQDLADLRRLGEDDSAPSQATGPRFTGQKEIALGPGS